MSILIENENGYTFDFDAYEITKLVVDAVLFEEKCPYESTVDVTLVNDEEIKRMNFEFRNLNRATDVLSFPLVEFTKPAKYDIISGDDASNFDPDSGELMLGDIVISVQTMIRQAHEYGHSVKREFAFLITHSMLHLLGYDHEDENDATNMEKKQKDILEQLRITR